MNDLHLVLKFINETWGGPDASFLDCVVSAHTDGELKTEMSHKSTKSIFVLSISIPKIHINSQTNVVKLVPRETLYV